MRIELQSLSRRAAGALVALTACAVLAAPAAAQCVDLPGCMLVWSDEFDGNAVDPTRWSFQSGDGTSYGLPPGWGNNELQYYRPENATVADGFLTITARQEPYAGRQYTSARMRSLGRGDWTYGRIEMRAKMPTGQGLWPAFWMLPSDTRYGTWAASGEIDVMEYIGSRPYQVLGTIHYGGQWPNNSYSTSHYNLPSGEFDDDFHVFAIEWEFGEIRWYVDDIHYGSRTFWWSTGGPFPAPFDVDFHLLLNLAVGGNLPGPPDANTEFPQDYVIDYVRVYQIPPDIAVTSPVVGAVLPAGETVDIRVEIGDDSWVDSVQFLQGGAVLGEVFGPPYEWAVTGVAPGCYRLRARALGGQGRSEMSWPVDVTVGTEGCVQAPYRMVPATVPGPIEAEDYDLGGPGVAFEDADSSNNGGAYRPAEGVDLEATADVGGGSNVGWTVPGEWIEYTVDAEPGIYDVEIRVASATLGGALHLEIDGVDATGPISFPATGGWQEWITVGAIDLDFDGGLHTLRLAIDDEGFNVNRIDLIAPPDADGDQVPDRHDNCPLSIVTPTVEIQTCDSGTPNRVDTAGCTYADEITRYAATARNHGQFVSSVTRRMQRAVRAREVDGRQKAAVVRCAATSTVPDEPIGPASEGVGEPSVDGIRLEQPTVRLGPAAKKD